MGQEWNIHGSGLPGLEDSFSASVVLCNSRDGKNKMNVTMTA